MGDLLHTRVVRNMSVVPCKTHGFFSPGIGCEHLLSDVPSGNVVVIANDDWSPATRWVLFLLEGSWAFCHMSPALKVIFIVNVYLSTAFLTDKRGWPTLVVCQHFCYASALLVFVCSFPVLLLQGEGWQQLTLFMVRSHIVCRNDMQSSHSQHSTKSVYIWENHCPV